MLDANTAKNLLAFLDDVGQRCNRTWNGASRVLSLLNITEEDLRALAKDRRTTIHLRSRGDRLTYCNKRRLDPGIKSIFYDRKWDVAADERICEECRAYDEEISKSIEAKQKQEQEQEQEQKQRSWFWSLLGF